jgi:hypothetical protein
VDENDVEKTIKIGKCLYQDERDQLVSLLLEYKDIFAWTYLDMPSIDPKILTHNIVLKPNAKPVKQKIRKMNPGIALLVKTEIEKLLGARFIHSIDYSNWISNIVAISKGENKIRMCTDFHDLNQASLKDDFPLPNIDMIVDSTTGHALLSFMDGFLGYNQIFIPIEDQLKTAFITPWGTFCWVMMPFGLRNAGATYQRAMTLIFHDYIHKILEDYVDDILVKSIQREDHVFILRQIFDRIRSYNMRLNPKKCAFGVDSGKLLGFIISK